MKDWTDLFDRSSVVRSANELIDGIIQEIYSRKLPIHVSHGLNFQELRLLYRWSIYVGTNTFIDRLLRISFQKKMKISQEYSHGSCQLPYFYDISMTVQSYYSDLSINHTLLNKISSVLDDSDSIGKQESIKLPKLKDCLSDTNKLRPRLKTLLKRTLNRLVQYIKPEIIGEASIWLNLIFPIWNIIYFQADEFFDNKRRLDDYTRGEIKGCSKDVFARYFQHILTGIEQKKQEQLSYLFAEWIDHVLPLSNIEGLEDRFKYYGKMIKKWNVKEVHSFLGYFYGENVKVFSILAKRKNARLISHHHGFNNFVKLFPKGEWDVNFYKAINQLILNDYYIAWGDGENNDTWDGVDANLNVKIINIGSVYLSKVDKWKKETINSDNIVLLYFGGPLRVFMASLEEISPEKNLAHRINVLQLLKKLLQEYANIKILYKPFPGTYQNDPIKELLADEFKKGLVELTNVHLSKLMSKVDIVFFDVISTGFAESVQTGVPSLVFSNKFDYKIASDEGKRINNELENCGMVFYDQESGGRSFKRVINDLSGFQQDVKNPIRQFKKAGAYPVSKKDFRRKLKDVF